MNREDIIYQINRLKKQRGLFLALGLVCLIGGVIIDIIGGVILGIRMAQNSPNSYDVNEFMHLMLTPEFALIIFVCTILVMGGITLLVLRAALLGTKIRRLYRQLEEFDSPIQ